jgi:FSR family fosmidomycin resistance protein-like MFS transporter
VSDPGHGSHQPEPFDSSTVRWMGAAHFVHDVYPAFVGVLLPVLIVRFDLSLAAAGLVASAIRWTSLLQPIAGHVTDHTDARRFIVLGSVVTAISVSLVIVAPSVLVVIALLLVAGVSHSLFHPAAASIVTRIAGERRGMGLSIFMTGGELGRTIGPLYIAAVLTTVSSTWAWLAAALPGLFMAGVIARRIRLLNAARVVRPPARLRSALGERRGAIIALGFAVSMRSVGNTALLVFLPTLLVGQGQDLLYAGAAIAAYELGGAAGALLGGSVSDRWGRRSVLAMSLAIGVPLTALALFVPTGLAQLLALAAAGGALLSGMPVQLAVMHELLPDNLGMATGLVYFTGTVGAILSLVVLGGAADVVGLPTAIAVGLGVALGGLVAVMCLPRGTATPSRTLDALASDAASELPS